MSATIVEPAATSVDRRIPWTIVLGAAIALMFGAVPILTYTSGLFMVPLEAEFGWNRVELSLGMSSVQLISIPSVFAVGWAMDHWGIKRVIGPLIFLFAVNVALMASLNSLTMFLAIYALFGFTSSSLNPLGFLKSISAYIEDRRGLAIGLTLSGTAVGAAVVPQFAQYMIAHHGWRTAYLALACLPALVALPSTLLFVREPQSGSRKSRERTDPARVSGGELTGLTFREALVTRSLWLVAGALFLVSAVINGTTAHAVPFLVDHHYTPQGAASVLAGVGLASVIGRIGSGFLFDRFFAPYVAVFFFGLLIVGLFLLAGLQSAAIAMICVGLTLGFELDMVGYLVPRYFGLRKFGQIYALLFGSLNAGGAVGPLIMGVVYTTRGNYLPAFVAFGVMLAIASVLMLCLPRYAFGTAGEIAAERG
jgi:MFS family permease